MKNILIITKIYPAEDLNYGDTKVVHYFVKEWQKMGYNVRVVHNFVIFPKIIMFFTRLFQQFLRSKIGDVVPFIYDTKDCSYEYEGVPVRRLPILKIIPHGLISKRNVLKQFSKIKDYLKQEEFIPDVVVAHWWSPQLELLSMLKKEYSCKTCMIIHNIDPKKTTNAYTKYFGDVDFWGVRSKELGKRFVQLFGSSYRPFLCYSGIPQQYIVGNTHRNFKKDKLSIIFVGNLLKRKHPLSILKSLAHLQNSDIERITYVGEGAELSTLKKFADEHGLNEKIHFTGKISRNEVSALLQEHDIFVMISEKEAFGLVYLEAMGAGCLTIASINEGMDGIIKHGENGFLCKAGNHIELANILDDITKMDETSRKRISDNAVLCAQQNTDYLAALHYLENLKERT